MVLIKAGNGKLPDGPQYDWEIKDTDDQGCRVMVAIRGWELTRPYPVMMTSADAKTAAEKLAAELLFLIKTFQK